jgi:BirA family biotin operon repressor/biotin-[acetyl-CoA-carboxylase] ligase
LVGDLYVLPSVSSTNEWLMLRSEAGLAAGSICLAEHQSAGRGRRGRTWQSPFAANIYLSAVWEFELDASRLGGLSLAIGVAVARAVAQCGCPDIGLKWPNDLVWGSRKLGGILLEVAGEMSALTRVVVGVGLNVRMPVGVGGDIDQPWVDLQRASGALVSRNRVATVLINELLPTLELFAKAGFAPFAADWAARDVTRGKQVLLRSARAETSGIALGVDAGGALLLDVGGGIERFHGGEVSLRMGS